MAIITRTKNWIDRECLTHTDLNAEFSNITDNIIASDLTNKGMIERATDAEIVDGTDEERAVTPAGMLARTGTTARIGLVQLEDSHTSVLTTKAACPKNVKEAYDLAGTMLTKATFNANTFIYAVNDNTPVIKTRAEVMALLSGQAGANFALNTHKITGLVDPTTDQEAATKKYVDDNIGSSGNVFGPATHSANYVPQWNGNPNSKTLVEGFAITAAGKTLIDDADAAAQRTTLGLGTAATRAAEDSMTDGSNLPDGHAVKTYGDANWSGDIPAGSQGDMLYRGASGWLAIAGTYNVKAYGAAGDNSTDDTAAIQAAIDDAEASTYGGVVFFPSGKYVISSTLIIDSNCVVLRGINEAASQIVRADTFLTGNTIAFDRGNSGVTPYRYGGIHNLGLSFKNHGYTMTSGAHLYLNNVQFFSSSDISCTCGYKNIHIKGGHNQIFTGMFLSNYRPTGYWKSYKANVHLEKDAQGHKPTEIYFENFDIKSSCDLAYEYGILIEASDGIWITNGDFQNYGKYGIYIKPVSGVAANGLFMDQANVDGHSLESWSSTISYTVGYSINHSGTVYKCTTAHTNHTPPNASYWASLGSYVAPTAGLGFNAGNGTLCAYHSVNRSAFACTGAIDYGVVLEENNDTGPMYEIVFESIQISNTLKHGFWLEDNSAVDIALRDSTIWKYNQSNSGYDGVVVQGGTGHFQIQNNRVGSTRASLQDTGIVLGDGCFDFAVTGNLIEGNVNNKISVTNPGSNYTIAGNTIDGGSSNGFLINGNLYVDGLAHIGDNLTIGIQGSGEKYLHIKGSDAAGGKVGGTIYQYMADDYDGTYNYFFMQPYEDDLTWGVPGAVRMKLTSTGDLYIDGTYYDTGASLDKSVLEGNKKWELLTSLVSAYQNHNLTLLAKPLRHKTGDKNGKINITKSSSELIQLQAECIAELHKRLEILEKRT